MKNVKKLIGLFLAVCAFSCSSDDVTEEDPVVVEPTVLKGVFLDSEVEGITYSTETQSGTTNAQGEFDYVEGETVTFTLGDIELGSAQGSEVMTPVTIASTEGATVASQEVMNIAALLQTLDADNDPSNGIKIETSVVEAISTSDIDFTQTITQVLGEIVAEVNQTTGSNLVPVYPQQAAEHLAETVGEDFTGEDVVFEYFIPTIESWTSYPRTSLHWIHETDADGKLLKSYMYEKHPYRVISEYRYLEYNELGQPTAYDQEFFYKNADPSRVSRREVIYAEDHRIAGLQYINTDGTQGALVEFTAYDESNKVTEAMTYDRNGNFLGRDVFVHNEDGNNLTKTKYSSVSGTAESDIVEKVSFEYTEFGDVLAKTVTDQTYGLQEWSYTYREDYTLEETIRSSVDLQNRERTDHYYYDEDEILSRLVITVGDYVSDYVAFYPNGDAKRAETSYQGFLYEIVEWNEDRSSVWTTINEADGTYKKEYKDANETIYKTEYYDADGNLLSTEP